jgi:hypothetical protein
VEKLPAGHFYIILDQANDIDIVPMVAYIGTRIKKCICNIPQKKSLDRCQKLVSYRLVAFPIATHDTDILTRDKINFKCQCYKCRLTESQSNGSSHQNTEGNGERYLNEERRLKLELTLEQVDYRLCNLLGTSRGSAIL